MASSRAPQKLRKQYVNKEYPHVVLKFEDGHEILVKKGAGKAFDCYAGERIKILVVDDPTCSERERVDTKLADSFDDATGDVAGDAS